MCLGFKNRIILIYLEFNNKLNNLYLLFTKIHKWKQKLQF